MAYYLGIDGGGTKTTCAVGDERSLLATATAGPSNIVRVGEFKARESLLEGVKQACAAAHIAPDQIVRTFVGGSGAARPELAAIVRRILAEVLLTPIDVAGDMETALAAAFDDELGVVVNAGTGSFAYGRNRQGTTLRAGGLGFAVGDEGSAHWIGREAVSTVLRAGDRTGEVPVLAAALCKAWGVGSLKDLARAANSVPPPDFSALAPPVTASHDEISLSVLNRAAHELAELADVVIKRLFNDAEPLVPVATIGSIFRHSKIVREGFYNEIRRLDPFVDVRVEIVEPVQGALRMARRAALV